MIVTCPNCGARYRLSDEVVARRARLKCAACDHRWVPEAAPDDATTFVEAPQPEPQLPDPQLPEPQPPEPPGPDDAPPADPPAAAPTPNDDAADEPGVEVDDDEPPRSQWVRNLVAVILGLALALVAAGLWVRPVDAARIPVLGETLARIVPASVALDIRATGVVTPLQSGGHVLEVTGTITNSGSANVRVPVLRASLAGPDGPARRWTIAPPVAELAPGASATFTSTVMGFPLAARTLSVTAAR